MIVTSVAPKKEGLKSTDPLLTIQTAKKKRI
jgi:hypothetical protein